MHAFPRVHTCRERSLQLQRTDREVTCLKIGAPIDIHHLDLDVGSQLNALWDLAEQRSQAQRVALSTTTAGRQILQTLGYST
ncbi:hypothetical protein HPB50_007981 [Hyalomma asiaticum]|uniref:Uncharacterized protein n=1 Tax=Hyalomma asiaticum TaxID=266040 RepID=A0ACB7RSX2_HYAAI|nr:hypothetical protein HPB50_007981 [Hyalomma asiaticum]